MIWSNLYGYGHAKQIYVWGFIDPKVFDTGNITITLEGKAYNFKGEFRPNPTPSMPQHSRIWWGTGDAGSAEFAVDPSGQRPVTGNITIGFRRFYIDGRFLVELAREINLGNDSPRRPSVSQLAIIYLIPLFLFIFLFLYLPMNRTSAEKAESAAKST